MLRHPVCLHIFSSDSADDASLKVKQSVDMTKKIKNHHYHISFRSRTNSREMSSSLLFQSWFTLDRKTCKNRKKKTIECQFDVFFFNQSSNFAVSDIFTIISPMQTCWGTLYVLNCTYYAIESRQAWIHCQFWIASIIFWSLSFFFVGVNLCLIF